MQYNSLFQTSELPNDSLGWEGPSVFPENFISISLQLDREKALEMGGPEKKKANGVLPPYSKVDLSGIQFSPENAELKDHNTSCAKEASFRKCTSTFSRVIRGTEVEIKFKCTTWRPSSKPR